MLTKRCLMSVLLSCSLSCSSIGQDDVADIKSEKRTADKAGRQSYFLIQPTAKDAPKKGFGLLVILPGGNGSEGFHPFIKRIRKHAVPKDFLVAQPIAVKWTEEQEVVWPTDKLKVDKQEFSTEAFVKNVVTDVRKVHKVDPEKVYCMGWSSSGPAVYSLALMKETFIKGSYISMSVYKPELLPPIANAKGRSIFIEHSPEDMICPYWMARKGHADLEKNGARTRLVQYEGGHGWRGDVYQRISKAISWLGQADDVVLEQNQLSNADLKEGKDSPKHWKQGNAIPGVKYKWIKSKKMASPSFLQISKTPNRFFPIATWSQKIDFDGKQKKIQLGADVKAVAAEKAVLDVIFLDKDAKPFSHKWVAYIGKKGNGKMAATHDWKKYSGIVEIPENTKSIVISLQSYGPGEVSFSNIQAKYVQD